MNMRRRRCSRLLTTVIAAAFISIFAGVGGLRDVKVTVPMAVAPGESVTLRCTFDLEGDPLYTVKWYKSRQEFYRYVPKEHPNSKVFPLPGFNVNVELSGENQVVLRDVQLEQAGKYRCEVSADAPSFHTEMVSSIMHVVYLPEGNPKLLLEKQRYGVDETVRGNCSSPPSNPTTNLTWIVNGKRVNASSTRRSPVASNDTQNRQVTTIYLTLDLDSSMFQEGKIRVLCIAEMFKLYRSEWEVILEEEKPRLASVLGTRESASDAGAAMFWNSGWMVLLAVLPMVALQR